MAGNRRDRIFTNTGLGGQTINGQKKAPACEAGGGKGGERKNEEQGIYHTAFDAAASAADLSQARQSVLPRTAAAA